MRVDDLRPGSRAAPRRRLRLPRLVHLRPRGGGGPDRRDVRARAAALAPLRPAARLGPHVALPGRAHRRARPLPLRAPAQPPRAARRAARALRRALRRGPLARPRGGAAAGSRPASARSSRSGSCSISTPAPRRACSASPRRTAPRASTGRSRSSRRHSMSQRDLVAELRAARVAAPPRCASASA